MQSFDSLECDAELSRIAKLEIFVNKQPVAADLLVAFCLPKSVKLPLHLKHPSPPTCMLPPSFHRKFLLEPWLLRIFDLFKGWIVDIPETAMDLDSTPSLRLQSRSEGATLFYVIDLKVTPIEDYLAQLFLALLSAALSSFRFYSYDPSTKRFSIDENIAVNPEQKKSGADMTYVSNKLFSIIMHGYLQVLRVSVRTGNKDTDSIPSSYIPMQDFLAMSYYSPLTTPNFSK
ncbi:hypothetical protein A0H81_01385 [Grifola frondosa]|uniref:Uncharacterized protein n=1 Tax=Grifola frondosa TaxID=5627 RepID=A0A1C7MY61_GRIFR|nr:hypothetical protein A0H81_01385 [Grifola frondosa]